MADKLALQILNGLDIDEALLEASRYDYIEVVELFRHPHNRECDYVSVVGRLCRLATNLIDGL